MVREIADGGDVHPDADQPALSTNAPGTEANPVAQRRQEIEEAYRREVHMINNHPWFMGGLKFLWNKIRSRGPNELLKLASKRKEELLRELGDQATK